MNIEIKKLKPEHTKLYREIRLESLERHPEAFETTYEEALKSETFFFEGPIKEESASKFVIGAFDEDSLIGICAFVDDNRYELEETGSIVQMYVKREYSGQKIGEKLLLQAEADALKLKGISRVMLEVNKNNKRAISVYRNCGYNTFQVKKPVESYLLCMTR